MDARPGTRPLEVVEIRRGVLEVSSAALQHRVEVLLLGIPHTSCNQLIYLSRGNADRAIQLLQQMGINIMSTEMEINALRPPPPCCLAHNAFGTYLIPAGEKFASDGISWKRYSFSRRRLLPVRPCSEQEGRWSLFLKEGQIVEALSNNHFLGYYLPEGTSLVRCKTPQEALEECHWHSLPAAVYFEAKRELAPYVALYHTPIWLPPKHRDLLYKKLAGLADKSNGEFALIHSIDLPLVKQILASLGILLAEGIPPEKTDAQLLEIVEIAAHAVQQAYTAYLKSERKLKELEAIVQERRWEQVEPLEFRQLLVDLANRAYDFEPLAEELLSYLIDRLPRSFDWKDLRDGHAGDWLLQGIVLDADSSLQFGPDTSKYYKVIVQEFGSVLGVMSKRSLLSAEDGQVRPAYFLASNWRATPYAGRLKLTGASSSVMVEQATEQQLTEEGYSHLYGIPTIEVQLAKELYLAAFFLDRDAEYWQGHNEFSRYFASHGRLVEKVVTDLDEPAALFQDVFGMAFYLTFGEGNDARYQHFLHAAEVGQWLQFVAHVGLRSLLREESSLPSFDLVSAFSFREAGQLEIAEATILGLLRYYGQLDESELRLKLQSSQMEADLIGRVLVKLVSSGRIARSASRLYYGYTFCSPKERVLLANPKTFDEVDLDTRLFYVGLRPFLPMIHPLGHGLSLTQRDSSGSSRQYRNKILERGDGHSAIVTRNNYQDAMKTALANVKRFGVSVVRVHPWNMEHALAIVRHIRSALPFYEIDVQRKDVIQMYGGKEVTESWLRISSPDMITRFYFAEQLRRSGIARRVRVEQRRRE